MPYKDAEAARARNRQYYEANKERIKAKVREYEAANKDAVRARQRAWCEKNRERSNEIKRRHAAKPEARLATAVRVAAWAAANRARRNEQHAEYLRRNPGKARAKASARRAALLERIPCWFGELDRLVAVEAADLAIRRQAATQHPWHVDHQIPLRGRRVSGLHVWNNLQVIPAVVNCRKRNHFDLGAAE